MQVSVSDRKKILKTRQFVEECMKKNIFSPSEMSRKWNEIYTSKPKEPHVFSKAMRRMGISPQDRLDMKHEAEKDKELRDIEDYEEVKQYLAFSSVQQVSKTHLRRTMRNLRYLWNWMAEAGYPNPRQWTLESIVQVLEARVGKNDNGQWKQPAKVNMFLGAFNRTFTGRLPKGYSTGLKREAGELKDYMRIAEFQEFLENLPTHAFGYPRIMWVSAYAAQVNVGAREGSNMKTGILSLKWENIDFAEKRCDLHEKGKKGKPARLWKNLPLDLFPFLHGWEALLEWHRERFGYYPTSTRHGSGRVFPVHYVRYLKVFHETRHKCTTRIKEDSETMKPHVLRKTHAQWLCNFGVPIEWICGQFPDGWYGVGWDDPKVLLKYYIDLGLADDARSGINKKMSMKIERLGLDAPLTAWKNVAFGVNAPFAMR